MVMETLYELPLTGPKALNFSYGQIIVYDSGENEPGSIWTIQHTNQGFVRRPHTVGISTLIPYGTASISVFMAEPRSLKIYERAISVPIELPSGVLCLEGPEEYPIERFVNLGPGLFRLFFCQMIGAEGALRIDIFVGTADKVDARSRILKTNTDLPDFGELIEIGSVG